MSREKIIRVKMSWGKGHEENRTCPVQPGSTDNTDTDNNQIMVADKVHYDNK